MSWVPAPRPVKLERTLSDADRMLQMMAQVGSLLPIATTSSAPGSPLAKVYPAPAGMAAAPLQPSPLVWPPTAAARYDPRLLWRPVLDAVEHITRTLNEKVQVEVGVLAVPPNPNLGNEATSMLGQPLLSSADAIQPPAAATPAAATPAASAAHLQTLLTTACNEVHDARPLPPALLSPHTHAHAPRVVPFPRPRHSYPGTCRHPPTAFADQRQARAAGPTWRRRATPRGGSDE